MRTKPKTIRGLIGGSAHPCIWRAVLALSLLFAHPFVMAEGIDKEKAAAVKAAYLYNFTKFVVWPHRAFSDSKAPYVIGVIGDDRVAKTLRKNVNGKKTQGRSLIVRHIKHDPDGKHAAEMRLCHILFVGEKEKRQTEKLKEVLKGTSILTVGDERNYCEKGGAMELKLKAGRISLRINLESVKARNLKVSSKLLRLAEIVRSR